MNKLIYLTIEHDNASVSINTDYASDCHFLVDLISNQIQSEVQGTFQYVSANDAFDDMVKHFNSVSKEEGIEEEIDIGHLKEQFLDELMVFNLNECEFGPFACALDEFTVVGFIVRTED